MRDGRQGRKLGEEAEHPSVVGAQSGKAHDVYMLTSVTQAILILFWKVFECYFIFLFF